MINRRQFVTRVALTTAGAVAFPKLVFSSMNSVADEYITAEISHGKIRGVRTEGVNIFRGVPYAGRISGNRRFRRPAPLESWTGVRDALQLGHPAIQPPKQTYGLNEPDPAEDCLFLNVWTPANDNKKRPVMFYNHGGGFSTGSGGSVGQDGANLARFFDVVVVETNHRLGIMGYLYLDEIAGPDYAGSGNMGMLDIVAGLEWVNKNIASFGGDPSNVMIFGESGGGAKTSCLYAMPSAAPFFNKASIESGPGVRMTPIEIAAQTTAMVLKELNIDTKNWKKRLDIPVAQLLSLQLKLPSLAHEVASGNKKRGIMESSPGSFSPVVDGKELLNHPFDPSAPMISVNKPLLVGWNEDEFTFFGMMAKDPDMFKIDFNQLKEKMQSQFGEDTAKIIDTYRKSRPEASAVDIMVAIGSISMMGLGSIDIAEKKAKQNGAPVYLYNFGYKSEVIIPGTDYPLGTPHAMDISFKFTNEVPPKDGTNGSSYFGGKKPERFIASHNMAELWTTFARTGKPAAKAAPEWPPYNLNDRPTMRIDTTCEVLKDRYASELKMWRETGWL
ncbi:MAG: carboxylesterase/lipase family protein [Bacteroidales bacterium]|nr:carboxylesterase/lipase family protein [Bacteroidales bacterium]